MSAWPDNGRCCLLVHFLSAITGAVYLYGVAASHYALQDNVYLGNIYLGLELLLLGACLLLPRGLLGLGLNRRARLGLKLLGLVGLVGLIGVYRSIGLDLPYGGQFVVVYLVAALVVLSGCLIALRRVDALGAALGLGVFGAALALALFALPSALTGTHGLGVYTQLGVDNDLADKPPILEGFGAALTLLVGVAVFLAARRWRPGVAPTTRGAAAGA
ncbi:MAG TPA: hypothetical protein VF812_14340 [Ktedonobacterales bacterium]